jgi:hypothetical protein
MISALAVIKKMIHPANIVFLILFSGCIPVQEFGKVWDEVTIDPELEGHWKQVGQEHPIHNAYQLFIRNGDTYNIENQDASSPETSAEFKKSIPPVQGRTLTIGRHKFLLMNVSEQKVAMAKMSADLAKDKDMTSGTKLTEKPDKSSPAGGIQRYAIENGILIYYMLNEGIIESAVSKGSIKGFSFGVPGPDGGGEETGLVTLDEATQRFLARLADEPGNWKETKFTRVRDLAADIEKSRTYPVSQKTAANTTVKINLPEFKFFCEGRSDIFRRHLQASPEWRVFQEGQEVIAYRRQFENRNWTTDNGSNGYVNNWGKRINDKASQDPMIRAFGRSVEEKERYQIRYKFCFDLKAPSLDAWKRHTQTVAPNIGDVTLKLQSDDQGIESVLVIGQPGFWFEFFEQAGGEERIKTREAIAWLEAYSRDLQAAAQEIEENGYAASRMPEGAIRHGKPVLELTTPDSDCPWCIQINSAVNPGQQGFAYLKAFDAGSSGAESETRSWQDREYIGWSKHPDTLFQFNTKLYLPREVVKKGAKIRVELWFRPTDGSSSPKWFDKAAPSDIKMLESFMEFYSVSSQDFEPMKKASDLNSRQV